MAIRIRSVEEPFESLDPEAIREAVEAVLLAEAMGLLEDEPVKRLDLSAVRLIAKAASEAGIAIIPAAALATERLQPHQLRSALRDLREALEENPAPATEWPALGRLFGVDDLAGLVSISPASLRRYATGSRPTPDDVAGRLHFLARVVAELKGAYNDIGVRRWFRRKRTLLRGKTPGEVLRGEWSPDRAGPRKVLELAHSLASSPAT
jgi:hypothetical protein